jgi:hypothetical protein
MINRSSQGRVNRIILSSKSNTGKWKKDAILFATPRIEKNNLFLTVMYSGGCKEHYVGLLARDYFIIKPNEIQANILLSHDSNSDSCKSIIRKELCFDLSPLKSEYQNNFQRRSGSIVLLLGKEKLYYEF